MLWGYRAFTDRGAMWVCSLHRPVPNHIPSVLKMLQSFPIAPQDQVQCLRMACKALMAQLLLPGWWLLVPSPNVLCASHIAFLSIILFSGLYTSCSVPQALADSYMFWRGGVVLSLDLFPSGKPLLTPKGMVRCPPPVFPTSWGFLMWHTTVSSSPFTRLSILIGSLLPKGSNCSFCSCCLLRVLPACW